MGLPINFESCLALSDACGLSSEPKCREIVKEHPATGGKSNHLNLFAGLKDQLSEVEITSLGICTKENSDYFSHRADATLGRQVGVISL